ncbi:MAG: hypothetical protein H7645_11820 [Candidatus Heimdallarchaeota archaeon]|nr:hypothetical protein [Candidatus Heimdallarchaeota archaeon]
MKEKRKYLFGLTIWTWIIGSIIGILFVFVLRHDLSGLEWFGSPTFGMVVLIVLMTSFYLVFRKRYIQPTITIIIWFFFLFIATTISMIALAYSNLGAWEDFQAMPVMGTFHLVLWVGGIHFSFMDKQRKPLYLLTLWTVILFFTTLIAMFALGFGLFFHWEEWQIYPIIGTGLWSGLAIIVYFGLQKPTISWIDSLFYWGWSMFLGIGTSMLFVYFTLLEYRQLWPFFIIAGTLGFAALFTSLKFTLRNRIVIEKPAK